MAKWKPKKIIVHEKIRKDPVTEHVLKKCKGIPIKYVKSGTRKEIVTASDVLSSAKQTMLDKILAGKTVLYIAPANNVVDLFTMPDDRMMCPHFERLKLASNGCFYQCDWCYLKLTYRAAFPFITIRAQYDKIKTQLTKRLDTTKSPVMFNSGELADSLALEHLSGAAKEFVPWFGQTQNGQPP